MELFTRALPTGTLVHNRYRITKLLGAGGFGVTYQVMDLKENRAAAMKEYMPQDIAFRKKGTDFVQSSGSNKASYEKFQEKFEKEAQIIYSFRGHPNIVEVRHLFRENNTAYYVMELLDGVDLGKYLSQRGGKINWETLYPIMEQVVTALNVVHNHGMIHCDISPDNIYILRDGSPKILDFGAARVLLHGEAEASVIMLKNGYAPPEQRFGRKMGTWTDVYALAVTIYRCLTGKIPPASEDRVGGAPVMWPSQMGVSIPSHSWEEVLKKAMALRADERYQTINEFWYAMKSAAPVSGPRLTVPPAVKKLYPDTVEDNTPMNTVYAAPSFSKPPSGAPYLECIQGRFAGNRMQIKSEVYLGVDHTRCGIQYPPGSPGISRVHLRLWNDNGALKVMDMKSTYGSWLNNTRMTPGLVYTMKPGMILYIGDGQRFRTR